MKISRRAGKRLDRIDQLLAASPPAWEALPLLPKKVLLIRPTVRGDLFAPLSYQWGEDIKAKALSEGWSIEDLGGRDATRRNVEEVLSGTVVERPRLILHYNHGTEFTLYGHSPRRRRRNEMAVESWVPAIDERNVQVTRGTFVSAVACLSAIGLGPLALWSGASGYLGYASRLAGPYLTNERDNRLFGEAVNATNAALLEGRSPAEAYERGWQAWDHLSQQFYEEGGCEVVDHLSYPLCEDPFAAINSDFCAMNRDGLTLLSS